MKNKCNCDAAVLVQNLLNNTPDALQCIYWCIGPKLLDYAQKKIKEYELQILAEDIVQETIIKVYMNVTSGKYTHQDKLLNYAYRIARNTLLNEARKQKRHTDLDSHLFEQQDLSQEELEDVLLRDEQLNNIFKELNNLTPDCQKLLKTHYLNSVKLEEYAKQNNLEAGTVRTKISRCRDSLRARLGM